MPCITCKFGGSSLADKDGFLKAAEIVLSDKNRKYIVVSAPGKRSEEDVKITDALINFTKEAPFTEAREKAFSYVEKRILSIANGLGAGEFIGTCLAEIKLKINEHPFYNDYIISRGEYLSAKIFSYITGYKFISPENFISVDENGVYVNSVSDLSLPEYSVIPGFYGKDKYGRIKTLKRGGGDVTGSIVAEMTNSALYENFTDVDGVYAISPKIIKLQKPLKFLSYGELEVLAGSGAEVFSEDAIYPLKVKNIPVAIKNTSKEYEKIVSASEYTGKNLKDYYTGTAVFRQNRFVKQSPKIKIAVKKGLSLITISAGSFWDEYPAKILKFFSDFDVKPELVSVIGKKFAAIFDLNKNDSASGKKIFFAKASEFFTELYLYCQKNLDTDYVFIRENVSLITVLPGEADNNLSVDNPVSKQSEKFVGIGNILKSVGAIITVSDKFSVKAVIDDSEKDFAIKSILKKNDT
ncbi:MAG: hypothetical protein HP008_04640, partial [Clostridia bacterium]|nr:hypothetical protein [Clostridia bacterium]